MNCLEYQYKLDLLTGELSEVKVQQNISIKAYFSSLNILNKSAHIYNFVYLANEEALNLLEITK